MIYYIGIAGKAGTGKDTVADGLLDTLKHFNSCAIKIPLAYEVKKMAMAIWGFTNEEVYKTKPPHIREKLQWLGTELIRTRDPDFWINQLVKNAKEHQIGCGKFPLFVLVPDIRFPNEATYFHQRGIVVKITRDNPASAQALDSRALGHESELSVDLIKDDVVDLLIHNNFPSASALKNETSRAIIGKLLSKVYSDTR